MHSMTREVLRATQALEFEQFQNPDDRDRLRELRDVALDQVADDVYSLSERHRGRIGRSTIRPFHEGEGRALWPRRTPDQQNIEVAFAPLLRELSVAQREVLDLFAAGYTEREVAAARSVTKRAVVKMRRTGLTALRRRIVERYALEDVSPEYPEPKPRVLVSGSWGVVDGRVFPTE
jgi:hypothetical protein